MAEQTPNEDLINISLKISEIGGGRNIIDIGSSEISEFVVAKSIEDVTPVYTIKFYGDPALFTTYKISGDEIFEITLTKTWNPAAGSATPTVSTHTYKLIPALTNFTIDLDPLDSISGSSNPAKSRSIITMMFYELSVFNFLNTNVYGVYKDKSLKFIIEDLFSQCRSRSASNINLKLPVPDNTEIYKQILIPRVRILHALSYLKRLYGIYNASTYCFIDNDNMYLSSIPKSLESLKDKVKTLKHINPNETISASNNIVYTTEPFTMIDITNSSAKFIGDGLEIITYPRNDLYKTEKISFDDIVKNTSSGSTLLSKSSLFGHNSKIMAGSFDKLQMNKSKFSQLEKATEFLKQNHSVATRLDINDPNALRDFTPMQIMDIEISPSYSDYYGKHFIYSVSFSFRKTSSVNYNGTCEITLCRTISGVG